MRTPNRSDRLSLSIPHPLVFVSKFRSWNIVGAFVGLLLLLLLSTRTAPVLALRASGTETDRIRQTRDAGLSPMFKGNHVFASGSQARSVTPSELVNSLQYGQSAGERLVTMTRLEQMGEAAAPALIAALASRDPELKLASSELLGWEHAQLAVSPLLDATLDSHSAVREAAVGALGEIADMQALPRVQQLQVSEGNYYVQQAAYIAEQQINALIANQLGIGPSELHGVAVAATRQLAYAVTSQGLFARRDGTWSGLSNLPSEPTDILATDANGTVILVGTAAGLYRSLDAGETWESVQELLPSGTTTRATALTINPQDSQQVFIALNDAAQKGASVGVYMSIDGGNTWQFLPDSPKDYVTTRLNFDPLLTASLYGATGVGVWRYALIGNGTYSGAN